MSKENLLVNPFTNVLIDGDYCILTSPKPYQGLQTLFLNKVKNSSLFELFFDLSKIRLDFLDIKNDLNDEERNLLWENGVLVEETQVPQKPLFNCQLSDVSTSETEFSDLLVNPSFRFEPLNLGNFNSFVQGNNLLPYQPSVWIRNPVTQIEIGYWLNPDQAQILSQIKAGDDFNLNIDESILYKLINSEILIAPQAFKKKNLEYLEVLKQSQKSYQQNGYVVLEKLFPPAQMQAMRTYYREYVRNGFMPFSDSQVKRRYYQHNEPLAKFLHQNLTKLMSQIADTEVIPSYVYAGSYIENAVLYPHTDRIQCEYSFSFQVDYQPEPENQVSPWGLFVTKPDPLINIKDGYMSETFPAESETEDANPAVYLTSGDALAYKGCELIHYRYALPKGHKSTSLFFHYVPSDFTGNLS